MSGIFFDSTGGSLMNRARPLWPETRDRHPVAADRVAREELLQRLAHQLGRIGVGLAENLGVFDVVEGVGRDRRCPRRRRGNAAPSSAHWPISIPQTASLFAIALSLFPALRAGKRLENVQTPLSTLNHGNG